MWIEEDEGGHRRIMARDDAKSKCVWHMSGLSSAAITLAGGEHYEPDAQAFRPEYVKQACGRTIRGKQRQHSHVPQPASRLLPASLCWARCFGPEEPAP